MQMLRQAVNLPGCQRQRCCSSSCVTTTPNRCRLVRAEAVPSSSSSSSTCGPEGLQQQQQERKQQQQCLQASVFSCSAAAAFFSSAGAAEAAQQLHLLSDLDAATAHSLESILRPLFAAFAVLYIIRIPMTWYPSIDGTKLPWLLAYAPTEPFLKATRNVIPLVGGVDITPIVWVGLISFFNEILLGPQGILMLIQRESGLGL